MKPEEMTAEELLDIIAGVPTLERNQAKAELLARLNAGGSGQSEGWLEFGPNTPPRNAMYRVRISSKDKTTAKWNDGRWLWDACDEAPITDLTSQVTHYKPATTGCSGAQPLQPRCPTCGEEMVATSSGHTCMKCDVFKGSPPEFFSAPPAMGGNETSRPFSPLTESSGHTVPTPASPQLEQVAREIAEHVFGCSSAVGQVAEFAQEILAILQRHFPGGEVAPGMKEVSKGVWTSAKCTCPNQPDEDGAYCPICGKEKAASPPVAAVEKHTNRHGERCSEACGQGRHAECTETLATCNCTYRGLHKTMHRYATITAPLAPRKETKE